MSAVSSGHGSRKKLQVVDQLMADTGDDITKINVSDEILKYFENYRREKLPKDCKVWSVSDPAVRQLANMANRHQRGKRYFQRASDVPIRPAMSKAEMSDLEKLIAKKKRKYAKRLKFREAKLKELKETGQLSTEKAAELRINIHSRTRTTESHVTILSENDQGWDIIDEAVKTANDGDLEKRAFSSTISYSTDDEHYSYVGDENENITLEADDEMNRLASHIIEASGTVEDVRETLLSRSSTMNVDGLHALATQMITKIIINADENINNNRDKLKTPNYSKENSISRSSTMFIDMKRVECIAQELVDDITERIVNQLEPPESD